MSRLRDWLRQNGLEQFADSFEANDVDLDILKELTEADLEQLGLSLGNRRRLAKALAQGESEKANESAARDAPMDAERRQLTVLFCDMVGSTALSGSVDPELLGEVLRRYQNAVAGVIGRFGGFVAKFMGDGVLAYFGYPRAFEDSAERAIRAAIDILAEVSGLTRPDGAPIEARIGVATGLVVVGEIIGSGPAQERTIVGETPNLAARLQALAAPGDILLSESTQSLLGAVFELEFVGDQELKGFSRPIPVWRVIGEAAAESRFAATRARRNLPLVGRAHEMGLLIDRWRLARAGEGQIVTVLGEAGIGKSRSVEALQEALAGEPYARIHLQGSPYHSGSALYPVIRHLGRAAGFSPGDLPATRIEKLTAAFPQRAASDPAAISLLAALMSLPPPTPLSLSPAQQKAATLALLVDEIVHLGEQSPVLLVVEDAHWMDATTLELMTRMADTVAGARVLALVTARPEFAPPWLARPHSTMLTLARLGRAECAQLVANVAAAAGLTAETVATIVVKTDGVPLFVEELTRSVMESAGEARAAVPATLNDSLMARLDRLGDAREIAQIAAVIGRQFSFSLLAAIARKGAPELELALSKLVQAGIVFPEGRGVEGSFSFKHALVCEAAYESLLFGRRREWHERIARTLEESFPEAAASEPELLAHHFGEAGLTGPACDYRMRAGERALSRAANSEAIEQFSTGLKQAAKLPDGAERMRRQLDFWLKLGPALMVTRGMQSPEVAEAYERAAEIGGAVGDDRATFKAKWGLWLNANIGRKTALARERARKLVALGQASGDGDLLLEAYHCRWSTAFFRGDVAETLDHGRVGMESYDISRHRHLGQEFGGHDPGVCAHGTCGLSYQMREDKNAAEVSLAKSLSIAEALDHPNSLVFALYENGQGRQLAGDREGTLMFARRTAAVAEKHGLLPFRSGSLILAAWATATGADIAGAARVIDAEIDNTTTSGVLMLLNQALGAEVWLAAGRPADALIIVDRAIGGIEEPGVGFYLPEIYRLRGECLLALDRRNKDEAQRAFTSARDIALQQGAVILARRAETALRMIE